MATNANSEPPPNLGDNESLKGATTEAFQTAPMMMTAEEIADCLQVSTRTVWRLKAKGDLPKSVKVGRAVRWRRSDIVQWIEQGCPATESLISKLMYTVLWRPIYTVMRRL